MNYWECRLHSDGADGKPKLDAVYITATSEQTVQKDLAVTHSVLREHFANFRPGVDLPAFVAQNSMETQGILGAIIAQATYLLRTSTWGLSEMGVINPRVGIEAIPEPASLGAPIHKENGVIVWLQEEHAPEMED